MFKPFRPTVRQMLFSGVGGSIGVVGVLVGVGLYVVETLTRPKKGGVFDSYGFSPYELGLPAESIVFPSQDSEHQVSGWYIPREDATTTILICPGYRTRKADILGMCAHLWRANHNVLAFEYYGHGTVVGKPVTLGYREINDFLGAVTYAKERAPQTHLGVMAYSMGAVVAIMCCAKNADVEALVSDSAFATHWSVVDYNVRRTFPLPSAPFVWIADYLMGWRAGYRFHQVEPLREIGLIAPRPVLIIHGGKDSMVDPRDATRLYEAAGEPKELWVVPEADHCGAYFVDRVTYTRRVIGFFERALKKPRLQLVEKSLPEVEHDISSITEAS